MKSCNSSAIWLVVPGVRLTWSAGGAALLNIKQGHCYRLNQIAARVWVTIDTCPSGIAAGDIVDVLETHFERPRKELERYTTQSLADLQIAGLVREKVVAADESSVERVYPSSQDGDRDHESK